MPSRVRRWRPSAAILNPAKNRWPPPRRELLEETGYEASDWIDLGHYRVDANRGAGTAYFFMAHARPSVAERDADDLEDQELLLPHARRSRSGLACAATSKRLPWMAIVVLALRQM